ncbi:MAG: ATP-binding protein [Bacteroidota bacterium]
MKTKKIVITGGPAVGKTSLIQALEAKDYFCFPEVIREFTLEETENKQPEALKSNPIVFADDSLLFNQRLIQGRSQQFLEAEKLEQDYVFFDRGLPDVLAYMDLFDQTYGEDFIHVCKELVYDKIFILPPWKEIFSTDEGRFETYEEGIDLYKHLTHRYSALGYQPIVVPIGTISERLDFIFNCLSKTFD